MKNKYTPTAIGLYLNYFLHGMGVLMLSQNMIPLSEKWGTDSAGVSYVISSLGIGRLLVLFISGALSDKFGRKPFVFLGMGTYILFFAGILFSPNITVAYFFGILAGMANSFLDSGTYPALMEIFPNAKGSANVLLKAFISGAQFALPLVVGIILQNGLWFGWTFVFAVVMFVAIGIFLAGKPFPAHRVQKKADTPTEAAAAKAAPKTKIAIEGVCFVAYGYISQATFYLVSQWITSYGQEIGMSEMSSRALTSYYAVGSLVCVFVTSILGRKKIKEVQFMLIYTFLSFIFLGMMWIFPSTFICSVGAFAVGFTAAGGVMQLGLTVMAEMFPKGKGVVTGIFYSAGSIASFTIPLITGYLSKVSVASIILFDVGIALTGFILCVIIFIRYRQLFGKTVK